MINVTCTASRIQNAFLKVLDLQRNHPRRTADHRWRSAQDLESDVTHYIYTFRNPSMYLVVLFVMDRVSPFGSGEIGVGAPPLGSPHATSQIRRVFGDNPQKPHIEQKLIEHTAR